MAKKQDTSLMLCGFTHGEVSTITLELERIDAVAEMAFPEEGPTTIQTALMPIEEGAERIGALLSARVDTSWGKGASHG